MQEGLADVHGDLRGRIEGVLESIRNSLLQERGGQEPDCLVPGHRVVGPVGEIDGLSEQAGPPRRRLWNPCCGGWADDGVEQGFGIAAAAGYGYGFIGEFDPAAMIRMPGQLAGERREQSCPLRSVRADHGERGLQDLHLFGVDLTEAAEAAGVDCDRRLDEQVVRAVVLGRTGGAEQCFPVAGVGGLSLSDA